MTIIDPGIPFIFKCPTCECVFETRDKSEIRVTYYCGHEPYYVYSTCPHCGEEVDMPFDKMRTDKEDEENG